MLERLCVNKGIQRNSNRGYAFSAAYSAHVIAYPNHVAKFLLDSRPASERWLSTGKQTTSNQTLWIEMRGAGKPTQNSRSQTLAAGWGRG
jgi:hypothetical protein